MVSRRNSLLGLGWMAASSASSRDAAASTLVVGPAAAGMLPGSLQVAASINSGLKSRTLVSL